MLSIDRPKEHALYELVSGWRRGIFTSADAKLSGYSSQLVSHHVASGNFIRIARGVYRLALFPSDHRDGLVSALIQVDPESAVVSHQSALELHGLSEVSPTFYEFTLPREKRYRGNRHRHPSGVRIHTVNHIRPRDIVKVEGIRVTNPALSIVDAGNGGIDPKLLRSAVFDAVRKIKATARQIMKAADERAEPEVRRRIADALADANESIE